MIITFSESGKIMKVSSTSGEVIMEILVHGFAARALSNIETGDSRNYTFRGELFQLASYEYLNVEEERIEERDFVL